MSFRPIEDGGCFHIWAIITTSSQSLRTVFIQICQECVPARQCSRQLPAQEEQDEEGDTGEEAGEEGGQDPLGNTAGVHPNLDPIQCAGGDEGDPGARAERGIFYIFFFGSVRSSRSHFVCLSIRVGQVCQREKKHSITISPSLWSLSVLYLGSLRSL